MIYQLLLTGSPMSPWIAPVYVGWEGEVLGKTAHHQLSLTGYGHL